MNHSISLFIFRILPTCLLSRLFGLVARIRFPRPVIRSFVARYSRKYGVRDEYDAPAGGFRSIDEFFTRRLREGVHRVDHAGGAVVSPVDARVDRYGAIDGTTIIQAKGLTYTVEDLIPSSVAGTFAGGSFMTLYLSPGDYHRIHSPVEGTVTGYFNIPGRLFTVQAWLVARLPRLYARNERIVSYIETRAGTVAVCKIGALNVGRITLSYCDERTNRTFRRRREFIFPEGSGVPVVAGSELGVFHLGSSIILLFQKDAVTFDDIPAGTAVRMGRRIGMLS